MNNYFINEMKAIFDQRLIWYTLGSQDIKLRYRRSSIGPFWITISMAVTIYSMGFLYGHLFNLDLKTYLPYLASGLIGWSYISTLIQESSNIFIESECYIKNQESFVSLFLMRLMMRNTIIFLHNLLAFLPIIFIFHTSIGMNTFLMIPGIILIGLNVLLWGTTLAVIGTRYRDFSQIINSIIQVVFFLTPIMWMPRLLPEKYHWAFTYNPFNQFLNLIRLPMTNQSIDSFGLLIVTLVTLLGFVLYAHFISKYKYRIVFWL